MILSRLIAPLIVVFSIFITTVEATPFKYVIQTSFVGSSDNAVRSIKLIGYRAARTNSELGGPMIHVSDLPPLYAGETQNTLIEIDPEFSIPPNDDYWFADYGPTNTEFYYEVENLYGSRITIIARFYVRIRWVDNILHGRWVPSARSVVTEYDNRPTGMNVLNRRVTLSQNPATNVVRVIISPGPGPAALVPMANFICMDSGIG